MRWGFRSVGTEMTVGGREVTVRDREVERAEAWIFSVPTLAPPPLPLSTWPLFRFSSNTGSSLFNTRFYSLVL